MSDFIIPKGQEFQFNIKIIEKDSFLAQDVSEFNATNSSLQFRSYTTNSCVAQEAGEVTMTKVADNNRSVTVALYTDLPETGSLSVVYTVTETGLKYLWNGFGHEVTTTTETYRGGIIRVTLASTYTAKMEPKRSSYTVSC